MKSDETKGAQRKSGRNLTPPPGAANRSSKSKAKEDGSPSSASTSPSRSNRPRSGTEMVADLHAKRGALTAEGLKNIKAWGYKPGTYTPLDNFLNKHFWTPSVKVLPIWMAPNLVTLLGLLQMVCSWLVLTYHSPNLKSPAPSWVYIVCSASVFMYQTLDALDGKQARRTGSSSPLGQLFDHGCDSVSTTFLCLGIGTTIGLGYSVRCVLLLFAGQIPFWFSQWSEYHTGLMEHSLVLIGVTEAQIVCMVVYLATGLWGQDFWYHDAGLGITLPSWYCAPNPPGPILISDVYVGMFQLCGILMILMSLKTVLQKAPRKGKAMLQVLPVVMYAVLGFCWCLNPQAHPRMVLFSLGMSFTFITNKMIVAAMSRQEYPIFDTILLPLPVLFVVERYSLLPRYNEILLGAYASYCTYKLYRYTRQVIEELTIYLGIYAFKLGKRKE